MKRRLLDLLVCPIDKTPLELIEWESSSVSLSAEEFHRAEHLGLDPELFAKEITTGVLLNRTRKIAYPIHQGIPRMLVFPTSVVSKFTQKHADRLAHEIPGFMMPHERAMPGEETVLRTFSDEWVNYDWDENAYWSVEPEDMYKSMHYLLNLDRWPVQDKLVLEVGIGIGGIADYMARSEECELVGVDLSYAVDPAYRQFGGNSFLHIVQASAFALPFLEETFDLVYSQGVLHHTFSTKTAFDQICKVPKIGGRLYIWLYNTYSERRNLIRRALMIMETIVRPLCWCLPKSLQLIMLLPIIPLYLIHQNLYVSKRKDSSYVKFGWREAVHAARDRFTPRYAHRHSEEEVCGWFREAGFTDLNYISRRDDRQNCVLDTLVFETVVDGVRR